MLLLLRLQSRCLSPNSNHFHSLSFIFLLTGKIQWSQCCVNFQSITHCFCSFILHIDFCQNGTLFRMTSKIEWFYLPYCPDSWLLIWCLSLVPYTIKRIQCIQVVSLFIRVKFKCSTWCLYVMCIRVSLSSVCSFFWHSFEIVWITFPFLVFNTLCI